MRVIAEAGLWRQIDRYRRECDHVMCGSGIQPDVVDVCEECVGYCVRDRGNGTWTSVKEPWACVKFPGDSYGRMLSRKIPGYSM